MRSQPCRRLRRAEPVDLRILAINDFHGYLRPSPGGIRIADPADATKKITVPAGGAEHMATLVRELREGQKNSMFVAAGDLIGASPFLSAMFHDEPTIEALSLMGLEVASVGNHEFDEGKSELLRMQNGGCHPLDGCQGPHRFEGAKFRYLAASTIEKSTGKSLFPPYAIREFDGIPVAFIGLTLKGTAGIVSPAGIAGLEFRDEAETVNALVAGIEARGDRGHRGADPRRRIPGRRLQWVPGHFRTDRRDREKVRQGGRPRDLRPHPSAPMSARSTAGSSPSGDKYGTLVTAIDLKLDPVDARHRQRQSREPHRPQRDDRERSGTDRADRVLRQARRADRQPPGRLDHGNAVARAQRCRREPARRHHRRRATRRDQRRDDRRRGDRLHQSRRHPHRHRAGRTTAR